MSYVNNSTLESPGAELNIFKLHTRAFEWHIALHRIVFSLWAVSAKSNFSVADLASKQSTQRAIFLFCSNLSTRGWLLCASCNSPVGFGCMWALFVAPWCLCYRTSKSRLSDHGFQPKITTCNTSHNCLILQLPCFCTTSNLAAAALPR